MEQNIEKKGGYLLYIIVGIFLFSGIFLATYLYLKKSNTDNTIPAEHPVEVTNTKPTGPGRYACSLGGHCKDWEDKVREENCTTTFADRDCLNKCADTNIRCKI